MQPLGRRVRVAVNCAAAVPPSEICLALVMDALKRSGLPDKRLALEIPRPCCWKEHAGCWRRCIALAPRSACALSWTISGTDIQAIFRRTCAVSVDRSDRPVLRARLAAKRDAQAIVRLVSARHGPGRHDPRRSVVTESRAAAACALRAATKGRFVSAARATPEHR